jgi:hypothetical protein
VRYLQQATREHQRRLRVQHWLLLLLRTLLVVALVLAAAGPSVPRRGVAGHAPSAMVLIVDNSASSAAVAGGTVRLDLLREAARAVLARATPSDAVWLVTADGVPRRGDPTQLRATLDALTPAPVRLDLGATLSSAGEILASVGGPAEVMVVSDLQRSALTAARVERPVTVLRPGDEPPRNLGISRLEPASQPWSTDGGVVTVHVAGDSGVRAPVRVALEGRSPREALVESGAARPLVLAGAAPGWRALVATLEPDEFRVDDRRAATVRVAPLAQADCSAGGRFAQFACAVLMANGRLGRGREVVVGGFGAVGSVITPPADAASVGALNRELARRGVAWQFGDPLGPGATDSGAVVGRVRVTNRLGLVPRGSGRTGVLATVGGTPWLVRDGAVTLLGSRLDTAWTDLPLTAGFVPFMDLLLNRLARGEYAILDVPVGLAAPVPDLVTSVVHGAVQWPVEGGGRFAPPDTGLYYLLRGTDTLGALAANLDPRESLLAQATDREVRSLWPGAVTGSLGDAAALAFTAGARSDLRGPLLWLALALGLAELALASAWGRRG